MSNEQILNPEPETQNPKLKTELAFTHNLPNFGIHVLTDLNPDVQVYFSC